MPSTHRSTTTPHSSPTRVTLASILCSLAVAIPSASFAESEPAEHQAQPTAKKKSKQKNQSFFIGLSTMPFNLTGLQDVHISDHETFGANANHGRVALSLDGANGTRPYMPGLRVGMTRRTTPNSAFAFGMDMSFHYQDVAVLAAGSRVEFGALA